MDDKLQRLEREAIANNDNALAFQVVREKIRQNLMPEINLELYPEDRPPLFIWRYEEDYEDPDSPSRIDIEARDFETLKIEIWDYPVLGYVEGLLKRFDTPKWSFEKSSFSADVSPSSRDQERQLFTLVNDHISNHPDEMARIMYAAHVKKLQDLISYEQWLIEQHKKTVEKIGELYFEGLNHGY